MPTASDAETAPRYTGVAQALHWITTLLVLAILPIAWVMTALPEHSARAGPLFALHKSLGVTIFLIVAARLLWRGLNPPPPLAGEPPWVKVASKVSHWLLYAVLLGMPISGYVMSASGDEGVALFGLPLPSLPRNKALETLAGTSHAVGQWALYALVVLHVAATTWHLWARRDGVLARMLPAQTRAPAALQTPPAP